MKCVTQRGFTLVELMVVIAIIGILAVALTTLAGKLIDSARAIRCKANLKALAQAAQNYGVSEGHKFPTAGSYEIGHVPREGGTVPTYSGHRGWVSWTKGNSDAWPWNSNNRASHKDEMDRETCYGQKAYISITNGALWQLVGKDAGVYVCDAYKSAAQPVFGSGDNNKIYRSYMMSGFFKYNDNNEVKWEDQGGKWSDEVLKDGKAAVRLAFAELPAQDARTAADFVDSVVEYEMGGDGYSNSKGESIGFNHLIAKRWVAHVAFVDGHVEGITLPNKAKKGNGNPDYNHQDLKDLTGQLCSGKEIKDEIRETMR